MKKKYIVRKTTMEGNYFYLHPDCGFLVECCNGGPYYFTNRKIAKDSLKYNNKYKWGYNNTLKDDILTLEEYLAERVKKLDEMEIYAKKHDMTTYRTNARLFLYLSNKRFGKTESTWKDITLYSLEDIKNMLKFKAVGEANGT